MSNFETIEERVQHLLETYPSTRESDHALYIKYFKQYIHNEFNEINFIQAAQSFEGLSRARRRVQEKYPELTDEATVIKRTELEQQYKDYYSGNFN
jgi:hypothetical protein